MNKVVTIHLDGIAYQLEEAAFDALRAYLDSAAAKLSSNPDKDEIIKDLEQAIGAKLSSYLTAHKNVLTAKDVDAVLLEMGPVSTEDDAAGATSSEETREHKGWSWPHNKRLYRIREGQVIAGVCNGLAAYFNVDVTLVRILFVLFTFLTHGFGILVYILMMLIVPRARTPKEYEEASGMPPITAQELVDRTKKSIDDFKKSDQWQDWTKNFKSDWSGSRHARKHQQKAWRLAQKQQWKAERYAYRHGSHSVVSELFGIACATLAITFVLWFLYGHVTLAHDFFNALYNAYTSFIASLATVIDSN
jgi:phage shock protein PspC (stress-responsive transcriptional regulator)